MRTDKPFQKSFICGGVIFVAILIALILTKVPNLSYRGGYVLGECFFPALITGVWSFFSKKSWNWGRFAATVIVLFLVFGFLGAQNKKQPSQMPVTPLSTTPSAISTTQAAISFSSQLPPSWLIKKDAPLADNNGTLVGHMVILQNDDKKRIVIIQTAILSKDEASRDFKSAADDWKRGVLDSSRDNFHGTLQEQEFTLNTVGGREVAQLRFQNIKPNVTFNCFGQSWMQGQILVSFEAIGQAVEVKDDKEIADIISSVVVN